MTKEVSEELLRGAQEMGRFAVSQGGDYLWVNPLDDGRSVFLVPMLHGNLRLAIGDPKLLEFDDVWCYQVDRTDDAWKAVLGWDGEGEPEHWYRHPATGRRRPGGDALHEVVYA